jgi:hypothetical protein
MAAETVRLERSTDDSAADEQRTDVVVTRRRRSRWWLVGAAVVVAVVTIVAIVVVNRFVFAYQPLERGGYAGRQGSRTVHDEFFGDDEDPFGDGRVAVYRYRSGEEFFFEESVHNSGSRSVTITGFPAPEDTYYATRTRVQVEADPGPYLGGTPARYAPFTPFNLDPGEMRVVRFDYRFRADCTMQLPKRMNPRRLYGGTFIEGFDVEFEYLGVTRLADLAFSTPIALEATGKCPAR